MSGVRGPLVRPQTPTLPPAGPSDMCLSARRRNSSQNFCFRSGFGKPSVRNQARNLDTRAVNESFLPSALRLFWRPQIFHRNPNILELVLIRHAIKTTNVSSERKRPAPNLSLNEGQEVQAEPWRHDTDRRSAATFSVGGSGGHSRGGIQTFQPWAEPVYAPRKRITVF